MWQRKFLFFSLLWFCSWSLPAQELFLAGKTYQVTGQQLNKLQADLTQVKDDLTTVSDQLKTVSQSFERFKSETLGTEIFVGAGGFVVGILTGVISILVIKK